MTLKQLTDLYVKGVEFPLPDGTVVWLQKLTPFEQGECRRLASLARARTLLALKEVGSEEFTLVTGQLEGLATDDLVAAVVGSKYAEMYSAATAAILIDPDWAERNEIRTGTDVSTLTPGSPEDELLTKLEGEYAEEVMQRLAALQEVERDKLKAMPRADLVEAYRELYSQSRGSDAFTRAFRELDLWFMLRRCSATKDEDGRWNHEGCDHQVKLLAAAQDLQALPEELLLELRAAEASITMSVRDARFSARQGSSSDSSPLPSAPVGSEPSFPAATPTPAGISR
ncbi:MAG: hypothetical protein ACXVYY_01470 [Oryzihumus sp.]